MTSNIINKYEPKYKVTPKQVHSVINELMMADGFDFVLDIHKSKDATLIDSLSGRTFHDFFSFFAAMPISINHPKLRTPEFIQYIGEAALNKPSNSDVYTEYMATFVNTFHKIAVPDYFNHLFLIDGGALAVENALKTAFDWKVRLNFAKGYKEEKGHKIIHFQQAFHGRSGYTMSLTNTDPVKTELFPKFNDWPRISNPKLRFPIDEKIIQETIELERKAIDEIKKAFLDNKDDIAAIIIEPIQCEGGDNHFRKEFFAELKHLTEENECLLIFDEVQTGVGITGTMWAHQQYDVIPDIMAFGKKSQVCGILAGKKIDTVEHNVFDKSSRINSTWGGNLVDMIRSTRNFEIIEEDQLLDNAKTMGEYLEKQIYQLYMDFPTIVSNPRGLGLLRAFSLPTPEIRDRFRDIAYRNGLIILGCGERSIRFRPTLDINAHNIDKGILIIRDTLAKL